MNRRAECRYPLPQQQARRTITLHSRSPRLIKMVEEMVSPARVVVSTDIPRRANLVVTFGKLNTPLEMWAASIGAMVVVLPEAAQWTATRMVEREWTVLAGSDMRLAVPLRVGVRP